MLPVRSSLLILAASVGLAGCATYDPYGYGGYGGRGYGGYGGYGSGVSIGYSTGYGSPYGGYGSPYYGGYGSPYYGGYGGFGRGFGYPLSYYGWYDNFYYPGIGYYVYSRDGSRHQWSDAQRRYWESRRTSSVRPQENWTTYRQPVVRQRTVTRTNGYTRPTSVSRQTARAERRAESAQRQQVRATRRSERRQRRDRDND